MIHLIAVGSYVSTHLVGILLAIVATYVVGFIWHGPLFGKQWMALNNMTPPAKGEMKFSMMMPGLTANFVMVFVQAAVLGRAYQILALSSIMDAFVIAIIVWLPFTALSLVNTNAWLGKPWKLTVLDVGHYLVSILAVAAVLYATL